jgi:hypothetical protein
MATPDMKAALEASLRGEERAVADRFAKADAFNTQHSSPTSPAASSPPPSQPATHQKVMRDGFTMPVSDYQLITQIRERCLASGIVVTKSEVLRAGLHALTSMPPEDLVRLAATLTKVKPGRPSAS